MAEQVEPPPGVSGHILRPYASLVVLLCPDDTDPGSAFAQLLAQLGRIRKVTQSRLSITLIAQGLDTISLGDGEDNSFGEFDQLDLTVYKIESRPGWIKESIFIDIQHEITIALRKDRIIAVHLPSSIREQFQNWLDKPPRPMVRRIAGAVFEEALLRGESRGLWLRGTHSKKKTKADSKNIAGSDLRQTLSVTEDQTYAMNSARSVLAANPSRVALTGTVGTTPTRSLVWNKATGDLSEFALCAKELLILIADTISAGPGVEPTFPLLAQPVFDFDNVWGAYDVACMNPIELPDGTDESKVAAAELLERALLRVSGRDDSPEFRIDVGLEMSVGGTMRGKIWHFDDHAQLRLGLVGEPIDPVTALPVRDALQHTDLLTVYYASGHTFTHGTLYKPQVKPRRFPHWEWKDFDGYTIGKEKPGDNNWGPVQIHEAIGKDGDRSLFGWVKQYFSSGWLTCDDGPGEIADFIHIHADTLMVTLIHVKGAESTSEKREISAKAYEVVTSQAVKNAIFLDDDLLRERLKAPPTLCPATWTDGIREDDRTYLIEAIDARDARCSSQVIIVQPHVSEPAYDRCYDSAKKEVKPSANFLRLQRLEGILNGGRPTMTGMGAELTVFGSLR